MKDSTALEAVKLVGDVLKWAALEYLLTTTIITVCPLNAGNRTMKSNDMSSHTKDGIGSGCKRPMGH